MSLWTPGGEHPVDRSRPEPDRQQAPPPEDEFTAYLRSLDGGDALDGHAVEIS